MEEYSGITCKSITYKSLIDRGFTRFDDNDEVHFNERGYPAFTLFKEFEFSKVEFSFNEIELNVTVCLMNDEQTLIKHKLLTNLTQLDTWLNEIDSLEQVLRFTTNKLTELFN